MKTQKSISYQIPKLNILAVIVSFSNWFKKNFICSSVFSNGHIPEPYLTETFFATHDKRCKRCKATLGLGKWKHVPPPPNMSNINSI